MMKQSKYALPEFWKTKTKQEPLWHGLFENKPIERNSFIISPVILNLTLIREKVVGPYIQISTV